VWLLFEPSDERACPLKREVKIDEKPYNTSREIRILTVDDHPVLREGIVAIVAAEPDMTVVAEAGNGREAIDLYRVHRPDITLMNLQMPILSGTDAFAAIRVDEHPFQTWRQRSHLTPLP
jgi:CheY-like chemotaxis protein